MRISTVSLSVVLALALPAGAKTVYVANDGIDAPGCGTKAAPCRTITQGIAAAAAGDTVSVGPGNYGDLDRDGALGEPGEEAGTDGVLDVTKAVRVLSASGAGVTAIDGGNATAVALLAQGVVFGARNRGFTVRTTGLHGISVPGSAPGANVAGNVVLGASIGIHVDGANSEIADNRTSENQAGIEVVTGPCVVARNTAVQNSEIGFRIEGTGCVLDGNAFVGNGVGLVVDGSDVAVRRSAFAGNRIVGAEIVGTGHSVEQSSFSGNGETTLAGNCGVISEAAVSATGNYWGSPTGPGDEPADLACGALIEFEPFAKKGRTPKLRPSR